MKKQIVILLLKYGLGLGLLAYVVWSNWHIEIKGQEFGISGIFERTLRWGPLVLAACVCLCSILITFVRWFVLVRAQDLPFTLGSAIRLGLIGFFLSTFLPGSVGGDIIKAAFLAREQSRRTVAVATVLIDRVLGLCALIWLVALLGGVFWVSGALDGLVPSNAGRILLDFILVVAISVVIGSITLWFLLGFLSQDTSDRLADRLERTPKLGHTLAEVWRAVWIYRLRGGSVALAMTMAMVAHFGFVLTFYLCSAASLGFDDIPSLRTHYLVVPVGMMIQAGVPTPGGVGGGELGYGMLYEQVGALEPQGVFACFLQRCLFWTLGLVGYLAYLRLKPTLPSVESLAEPEANACAMSSVG